MQPFPGWRQPWKSKRIKNKGVLPIFGLSVSLYFHQGQAVECLEQHKDKNHTVFGCACEKSDQSPCGLLKRPVKSSLSCHRDETVKIFLSLLLCCLFILIQVLIQAPFNICSTALVCLIFYYKIFSAPDANLERSKMAKNVDRL